MIVDFRFAEIELELMSLVDTLNLVKTSLPAVIELEKARIRENYDDERVEASYLEYLLEAGVSTRFLTAALVVSAWAVYENGVKKIATYIAGQKNISLRMSQLRGGFVEQSTSYFADVLHFSMYAIETDRTRIDQIAQLRHVIAHANGNISDVRDGQRQKLLSWIEDEQGVDVDAADTDYLVVSPDYTEQVVHFIDRLVRDLIARTRSSFDDPHKSSPNLNL